MPSPFRCLQHLGDGHVVLFVVHASDLQHFSSGKYGEFPPLLQSDVFNSFTFLVMMQTLFLHHIVSAAFFSLQLWVICLVELYNACYAFAKGSGLSLGIELFHVPL